MLIIRWIMLTTALVVILASGFLLRRVGLGEWGFLAALFAWVIVVESGVYIGRRFLHGLRRGVTKRPKRLL